MRPTLLGFVLTAACAGGSDSLVCGEGTVEHDGVCLPAGDGDSDADACAEDPDVDGDESPRVRCGGEDCDDAVAEVHPGADDAFGDDVDQNCDGADGFDGDGDGYARDPGDDCNDVNPDFYPGAPDPDGDCIDQACDGTGGPDDDGDGFDGEACGGDDCDDGDAAVSPAAADPAGDGLDVNCDGIDGEDLDGDGFVSIPSGGDDCNDGDADAHPGAVDLVGNGTDEDCGGADGIDADADGHASRDSGGDDCDDANAAIHPGVVEDEEWTTETVDDTSDTGYWASIALDGDVVHIGYEEFDQDLVRHARNALGFWVLETVADLTPGSHEAGSSFVLDGGFSHLFYYDNYPSTLDHSTDDPFPWFMEVVDGRAQTGSASSATLDDGNFHVAYSDWSGSALRWTTDESGAWVDEVVDAEGCGYTWNHTCQSRIAVEDGVVHVAYDDALTGITYARRDVGGGWTIETLDVDGEPMRPFLSVEGGVVRVIYTASTDLHLATYDGGWEDETIHDAAYAQYVSAVVEDGVLHVAYSSGGDLLYATNLRGAWEHETADSDGYTGSHASIAMSADTLHVAYRDEDLRSLRHATRSRPDGVDSDCDGRD